MPTHTELQDELDDFLPPKHPDSMIVVYSSQKKENLYASKAKHFLFSNDENWNEALSTVPEIKSDKRASCLLVGESNWLSLLPDLEKRGIKALFFSDIDPMIRHHVALMKEAMEQSKDRKEFFENYQRALADSSMTPENDNTFAFVRNEKLTEFFLFSEERYQACKESLSRMEVYYVGLDLANQQECGTLGRILTSFNYSLNLINISNIADYVPRFVMNQNLQVLTGNSIDNVWIGYSENKNKLILNMMPMKEYRSLSPAEEATLAPNKTHDVANIVKYLQEIRDEMKQNLDELNSYLPSTPMTMATMKNLKNLCEQVMKNRAIAYHSMTKLPQKSDEYKQTLGIWHEFNKLQRDLETMLNRADPTLKSSYVSNTHYFKNWRDLREKIRAESQNKTTSSKITPKK